MVISLPPLEEDSLEFTFRESGSIRIPKEYRERAITLEVVFQSTSVARDLSLNFRSQPPITFLGYATLATRDALPREVQLSFPRFLIYSWASPDAILLYQGLVSFLNSRDDALTISRALSDPLGLALDTVFPPASLQCPTEPYWIQTPLREVYVKSFVGSEFTVTLIRKRFPLSFQLAGCTYSGASSIADTTRDSGLPASGIFPVTASAGSPFAGRPAASSPSQLGQFRNTKNPNQVNPQFSPNGFLGGQCEGVQYRVVYTVEERQTAGCLGATTAVRFRRIRTTATYAGPIIGIVASDACDQWDSSASKFTSGLQILHGNNQLSQASGTILITTLLSGSGGTSTGYLQNPTIESVERVDGLTDDC